MLLEVIALSPEDAKLAARGGADRIELVSAIEEGGLTPAMAVMEEIAAEAAIPVHVMIRPHSRDFHYSEEDMGQMVREMKSLRFPCIGAYVLGVLTAEQKVDEEKLKRLLDAADGVPVTFHRAFDEARNLEEAYETLSRYPQIRTVLTSGGKPSVLAAVDPIKELVRQSRKGSGSSGPEIMAGSGLTLASVSDFVKQTGVRAVHFGSGVRQNGRSQAPIDPARLAALLAVLKPQ
ncbi:copper homeostasis protein CutC [Paenibacillus lignilyticus]|uniref:PF03932 family protein CutC n=1 Tax=Paenibacillus lignilyticus TaxID=1172615 RepID=A0ABS5CBR9_9BACL|nr:copper homeostasis protein CutC [Paenibacillus lignilyticus]MBP3962915.1 copper homeostasis protein CutC [Paenibacillus lignilyticus]